MEFISNPQYLSKIFERLCKDYNHFEWAVAWAGEPSNTVPGKILNKYIKKCNIV